MYDKITARRRLELVLSSYRKQGMQLTWDGVNEQGKADFGDGPAGIFPFWLLMIRIWRKRVAVGPARPASGRKEWLAFVGRMNRSRGTHYNFLSRDWGE